MAWASLRTPSIGSWRGPIPHRCGRKRSRATVANCGLKGYLKAYFEALRLVEEGLEEARCIEIDYRNDWTY